MSLVLNFPPSNLYFILLINSIKYISNTEYLVLPTPEVSQLFPQRAS